MRNPGPKRNMNKHMPTNMSPLMAFKWLAARARSSPAVQSIRIQISSRNLEVGFATSRFLDLGLRGAKRGRIESFGCRPIGLKSSCTTRLLVPFVGFGPLLGVEGPK